MHLLKQLFKYYFLMMGIFFIGRCILFMTYYYSFEMESINIFLSFIHGIRMDTITASMLLVFPMFILTLTPPMFKNVASKMVHYYFLLVFILIIYIENATIPFFAQYDVRPNYLFTEYLAYPKEVFSMVLADYGLELFIAFLMILICIYCYEKFAKNLALNAFKTVYLKRLLLILPLSVLLFIGIRSSFGHRPANNSDAMFSQNRILNEVTKNSLYSIGYAVYANKNDSNDSQIRKYGQMSVKEAFKRLKTSLNLSSSSLLELNRTLPTHFKQKKPKNLVMFVQESMGAQFVEAVGGESGITPHLNALSTEGILFKNLYSNGTRSVRGLAALTSGNFAIPGKGVIKRNKSQHDFFTFSKALKPLGYKSLFIYGGESRFDNMKGWYLGNGFDEIIDETSFLKPFFKGTWGVSDEDLVKKANERFKLMYAQNQKFSALMFSTSNHAPFDFPDNKIDLVDGVDKKSVKNAIKYADYAIGEFIKLAKKEQYYNDTVFVIVADHNVRVYGNEVVPVSMFQIPGLILGKDIKPMVYNNLATQPDVLATALDLMGVDIQAPIMGNSIFSDKKQNISLMQFHTTYALRINDEIAVIQPNTKAQTFFYENKRLKPIKSNTELEKNALAFVIALNYIYEKKLY